MFIESVYIILKGKEKPIKGYYIGLTDNSEHSTILTTDYKPLEETEIEDIKTRTEHWVQLRTTTPDDLELVNRIYKN